MKRAPIIPRLHTSLVAVSPADVSAPSAAPVIDSLIARVGAMAKGNTISLPVCGKDVRFALETIPGDSVETTSFVWVENERDQALLTEEALDDLLPSFLLSGQQIPAFGRRIDNKIEIADGSRRRMCAILTSSEYRVLVGELTDEQMAALSKFGNEYRPTSSYERGKRYARRLEREFQGNISALAEAENISRKIITRCVNTAKIPHDLIALLSHPGELSARAGDSLHKLLDGKELLISDVIKLLKSKKSSGIVLDVEEIIQAINDEIHPKKRISQKSSLRQYTAGASVTYRGDKVTFSLDVKKIAPDVIQKIENILEKLTKA